MDGCSLWRFVPIRAVFSYFTLDYLENKWLNSDGIMFRFILKKEAVSSLTHGSNWDSLIDPIALFLSKPPV